MDIGKYSPVIFSILMGTFLFSGTSPQKPKTRAELVNQWTIDLKDYPPLNKGTELEFKFSFPPEELSEKGIYLWQPCDIGCDSEGNIYVLDQKQKCIHKFNSKGRFILKKGRHGQGPGEFINPLCFYIANTSIFVSDTFKRDIQVFDLDLNLIRTIKVTRSYIDIAVSDRGFLVAVPFRMDPAMPLVDILDQEGQLLYSFGKPMFGSAKVNWIIWNFVIVDVNKNDEVFIAFQHFPLVCKYSIKGDWISNIEIDHKRMKYSEKMNIEAMKDTSKEVSWQVIHAVRAKDNGFYLLHNYPIAEILEFNQAGQLICDYWASRSYDYRSENLIVRGLENKGLLEILLLAVSPENKVEVFYPKK